MVKFFKDGFFGYSDEIDFHMFSIWHFLPIVIMIVVICLIYKFRKQIRESKFETSIRYIFAFIMLIVEMSFFWRMSYVGSQGKYDTMLTYLPLQMCQWGLILMVFTILSKNRKIFSINYNVTLLFATIALVYPLVISNAGPSYYRYYQFWLEHTMPIIGVFYLMFVHGLKPDYIGIYRTFACIIPLGIVAMIANNAIPDANYLYLKLDVPFLPENQICRAIILIGIVFVLFHLMYYIFYKIDNRKNKKIKNNSKH